MTQETYIELSVWKFKFVFCIICFKQIGEIIILSKYLYNGDSTRNSTSSRISFCTTNKSRKCDCLYFKTHVKKLLGPIYHHITTAHVTAGELHILKFHWFGKIFGSKSDTCGCVTKMVGSELKFREFTTHVCLRNKNGWFGVKMTRNSSFFG